jgi:uncharacterized transporter YbjL
MRFRLVILWILLALLPLRGWATGDMQVSMALGTMTGAVVAASAMQAAPEAQHHAAAPCHGDGVTADAAGTPEPSGGSHAACTLCDLCHSVAMAAAEPQVSVLPMAIHQRMSLVSADTGHLLIARLDRPPRSAVPV